MTLTLSATRHIDIDVGELTKSKFFPTLRRCPECKRTMTTNGHGSFRCTTCGYHDHQSIKRLRRLAGRTTGTSGGWEFKRIIRAQTRGK